jgi:GTPase SAR1 family protein
MLKWFAPLLLLAAKPEVLIRLVVAVLACAVLLGGVWLISNIALTFDALKNPYVAAAYGAVLLCFFMVVGSVAWLRLRRLDSPKAIAAKAEPAPLPREIVAKRAKEVSAKWEAESRRSPPAPIARIGPTPAASSPGQPPARAPARTALCVTGPAHTGKTALIARLVASTRAQPPETTDIVRLVDAGPIDGDERSVAAFIEAAAATDGVLFVVDQDLRAPEVAAIARLVAGDKPLYVVLNKADQFNAPDRDAILLSIRAKMPIGFAGGHVVSVAGEPSTVEREIEDARGAVRIETRRPAPDIAALTQLLRRVLRPGPERPLQFETAS